MSKLDRLSRSVADFAKLLEQAQRKGWSLVVLDLGIDATTAAGEMVANVMASLAQWERRMIGERTRAALAVKKQQGVRLGREPKLDAKLRARIRRARQRGRSFAAIADQLNAENVPTAQGGAKWHPSTVSYVVHGRRRPASST